MFFLHETLPGSICSQFRGYNVDAGCGEGYSARQAYVKTSIFFTPVPTFSCTLFYGESWPFCFCGCLDLLLFFGLHTWDEVFPSEMDNIFDPSFPWHIASEMAIGHSFLALFAGPSVCSVTGQCSKVFLKYNL